MLIPKNTEGKPTDLHFSVKYDSAATAVSAFNIAKSRLQNPREWKQHAGWLSATFALCDQQAIELRRPAETGDFIRINIPGPGTDAGKGYDWVRIDAIEESGGPGDNDQTVAMRVRPSAHPSTSAADPAHFFTSRSTSIFVIRRETVVITVSYYGRNEVANTETQKAADNARNKLVAAGAQIGLSEAQWTAVCKGFLHWT